MCPGDCDVHTTGWTSTWGKGSMETRPGHHLGQAHTLPAILLGRQSLEVTYGQPVGEAGCRRHHGLLAGGRGLGGHCRQQVSLHRHWGRGGGRGARCVQEMVDTSISILLTSVRVVFVFTATGLVASTLSHQFNKGVPRTMPSLLLLQAHLEVHVVLELRHDQPHLPRLQVE